MGSAVVARTSKRRHHVDDAGGEGGRGEAGVRLPAAAASAIDVVGDSEDEQVAGQTRRAVDGVDDAVQTAVKRGDLVRYLLHVTQRPRVNGA